MDKPLGSNSSRESNHDSLEVAAASLFNSAMRLGLALPAFDVSISMTRPEPIVRLAL